MQVAFHILAGTGPGLFGFDWKPAPIFSLYPQAWVIGIFGDSVAGFRLFPVLLSLVLLAAFYLLARRSMRTGPALGAMLLLGTNLWVLHFSRTAWENLNAPLFAVGACYALTRALQSGRVKWWTLTGVFMACGLYGYFSGRFIFVAVVLGVLLAIVTRTTAWRPAVKSLALAGLVAAVLFSPMAKSILDHWDYFNQRTNGVSVLNGQAYEGEASKWRIVTRNVARNVKGFVLQDGSEFGRGLWGRYNPRGRAPLDRATTLLFWGGLAVGALRWRKTLLWWPYFVPLFIAEVFSRGTPDGARGLIIAPFYFLFAGLFLDEALQCASRYRLQTVAAAVIGAIVLSSSVGNGSDYFSWQRTKSVQLNRLPGVDVCEYPAWRQAALDSAKAGPGIIDPALIGRIRMEVACTDLNRTDTPNTLDAPAPSRPTQDLTPARRDDLRRDDLRALGEALQRYFRQTRRYPDTVDKVQSLCTYVTLDVGCTLRSVLTPLPADPLGRGYWYRSDGSHFTVYAEMEAPQNICPDVPPGFFAQPDRVECVSETTAH